MDLCEFPVISLLKMGKETLSTWRAAPRSRFAAAAFLRINRFAMGPMPEKDFNPCAKRELCRLPSPRCRTKSNAELPAMKARCAFKIASRQFRARDCAAFTHGRARPPYNAFQ